MCIDQNNNLYFCAFKLWKKNPSVHPFTYKQLSKKN